MNTAGEGPNRENQEAVTMNSGQWSDRQRVKNYHRYVLFGNGGTGTECDEEQQAVGASMEHES